MRLLLVEDYPPLAKSVVEGLCEAGYAVDVTGDGEEGLRYARCNEYDAIILDLMMPGMDGLTILRKLQADGRQVHVLILTAKGDVSDRVTGLEHGADDYLVKPFAFAELLARVHALVRREYRRKDPCKHIGGLRIDTASQRVWRDEDEVRLTAREYALLEYLAMREGDVVSCTEIRDHVCDLHSTATSNVVDVYIGYLRRKIDLPGKPPLIRTVRGRGYTLDASS